MNNRLTGNAGDNRLVGGLGDDTLIGGLGNDELVGSGGTDTADYGTAGGPVFIDLSLAGPQDTGFAGTDSFSLVENLRGSAFGDTLSGDVQNNVLTGNAGIDTLNGRGGRDQLVGGAGGDTLNGDAGADTLDGGDDGDTLDGGADSDRLFGGAGSDTLRGGLGSDSLTGGAGADVFDYDAVGESTATGRDTIADYVRDGVGGETIDLSGIDADENTVGIDDAFEIVTVFTGQARQLTLTESSGNTTLRADDDGDGQVDFTVLILGVVGLAAEDFAL